MPSVISCPSCQKQLKVKDELIGRSVKCPGCQETFTAQVASQPPPAPAREEIAEKPRKKVAPPPEEEEDDEAPRRPVRRRAADDEDEQEDERPSRRRRRGGVPMAAHRGVLILLLGIGAFVVFGPLGVVAWILGNKDLKEMDEGRMDPEGRGMTQIGKIIGMIATIMMIVGIVLGCLIFIAIIAFGGFAASNAPRH